MLFCFKVFGHSGPAAAPVSRNYPEMRERLRTLLNKKKRSNKNGLNAAQASKNQAAAAAAQTDNCSQAVSAAAKQPQQPAAAAVNNAKVVTQNPTAQQPVQISNVQRKVRMISSDKTRMATSVSCETNKSKIILKILHN